MDELERIETKALHNPIRQSIFLGDRYFLAAAAHVIPKEVNVVSWSTLKKTIYSVASKTRQTQDEMLAANCQPKKPRRKKTRLLTALAQN